MAILNDFVRRLSLKLERGSAMRLEPSELSLLVSTGAFEKLQMAAAEELKAICRERDELRSATAPSTEHAALGQPGEEDIEIAYDRARRATRMLKPVRHRPPNKPT